MHTKLVSHDFDNLSDFRTTVEECFPAAETVHEALTRTVMDEEVTARMYTAYEAESGRVLAQFWNGPVSTGSIRV